MRVLLIEDNPGDARLVQEMLKEARANFTIHLAEKLGAGMTFLASQNVDAVLLDLSLPDSHGLETIAKLQTQFSHLPIIIMTSLNDKELARSAVRLGAQDYLVKGNINGELLRRALVYAVERKRAEEALREIGERLNRSQEIAHLGSWELDLANNRLFWSDEVYRIFGLKPQEFGATYEAFLERVHPDDRAAVDAAYSGSLREGRDTYEIEHRVVKKDTGEIRIIHEKCEHFRDETGGIIRSVGMVHDITERKKAEEAIKRHVEELAERNEDLVSFNSIAVDRELRMVELKKEINALCERVGEQPRYPLDFEKERL